MSRRASAHRVGRRDRRRGLFGRRLLLTLIGVTVLSLGLLAGDGVLAKAPKAPSIEEIHQVVQKVQARYRNTTDLQADFTQSTAIAGFVTALSSRGRVYLKKPGRLRWDYLEPNVERIYVNGDQVQMYVPEHKQVLVGALTQMAASQAPLQLLQGVAKLERQFVVEPTQDPARGEGGVPLVTLRPKLHERKDVQSVERIVLELQPKTYYIKAVSIHEISGNVSRFEFSDLRVNTGLADEVFEFQVPAGVAVVKAPSLGPP
ncbi:MAG: LolA family protein [Nitrospirales bacterium]